MNFEFNTGAERIAVLEDLRKPTIIFRPAGIRIETDNERVRSFLSPFKDQQKNDYLCFSSRSYYLAPAT